MNTNMTQSVVSTLAHVGLIRLTLALLLGLTLVSSHPAFAASNIGNGTAASCTETALENALLLGGTLTFNCGTNPITIKITREKLISKNGSLDGRGKITLDGQGKMRIFFQNKNQVNNGMSFSLKNMILTNGQPSSTGQDPTVGGCIYIRQSTIELVNMTLSNCKASRFGGGIRSYLATVKATNSNFINNRAYMGAAIFSDAGNIYTIITNSKFTGNQSDKNGGAVCVMGSPITITGSTFDKNTVTGNSTEAYPGLGGGVYVQKSIPVKIENSTFSNNKAFEGGGLFIDTASNATINNTKFLTNSASVRGGGLDTYKSVVSLTKNTFTNNFGKEMGGGINNGTATTLVVEKSSFTSNRSNGSGGAIANFTGPLTLNNSQIMSNTGGLGWSGSPLGGGIVSFSGQVKINNAAFIGNVLVGRTTYGGAFGTDANSTIINTTFYGNQATSGGAVYVSKNTLTLSNDTLVNNKATSGGNIRKGPNGKLALRNSIVAKPAAGGNCSLNSGDSITDNGNNIQFGDITCLPKKAQVDPKLDSTVKNNGGNTLTLSLNYNSPAINTGSSLCPTTDQRGFLRKDGKCDIGAQEKGAVAPATTAVQVARDLDDEEIKVMAEVAPQAAIACTEAALDTALAVGGAITFNCGSSPVTIKLTTEKQVTQDTSIDGGGLVTLDGQSTIRLFYMNKDATNSGLTFTLSNISLTNGKSSGKDSSDGGCIFNRRSNLVLNKVTVSNCKATDIGGVVRNLNGSVTATNSTFTANKANDGGVIYSDKDTTTSIKTSIFKDNIGGRNGGAISITEAPLTIEDSLFQGNSAPGNTGGSSPGLGGGVYTVNGSDLSGIKIDITGTTFDSNSGKEGGAVFADSNSTMNITGGSFTGNSTSKYAGGLGMFKSVVKVTGSSFSNNQSADGGAIHNGDTTLTLEAVTVSNSSATGNGGAMMNNDGTVTINNSTFTSNKAGTSDSGAEGGAMVSYDGKVTINNSTFVNNEVGGSSGFGGAINSHDDFTVINSTFNGNKAAKGGAIYGRENKITLRNITVAGNSATNDGGGVGQHSGATVALQNNILAGNTPNNCVAASGSKVTDSGNNIQSDTSCFPSKPAQDPLLDTLKDNGGATQTMALTSGSPAIDAGNAGCPSTDQRGAARVNSCDIGAFEFGGNATNNPTPTATTPATTPTATTPAQTPTATTPAQTPTATTPAQTPTATTPAQTPTTATPTATATTQSAQHFIRLPLILKSVGSFEVPK